jgi:hypothetical protein
MQCDRCAALRLEATLMLPRYASIMRLAAERRSPFHEPWW